MKRWLLHGRCPHSLIDERPIGLSHLPPFDLWWKLRLYTQINVSRWQMCGHSEPCVLGLDRLYFTLPDPCLYSMLNLSMRGQTDPPTVLKLPAAKAACMFRCSHNRPDPQTSMQTLPSCFCKHYGCVCFPVLDLTVLIPTLHFPSVSWGTVREYRVPVGMRTCS